MATGGRKSILPIWTGWRSKVNCLKIYPTLLNMLEVTVPEDTDGKDLNSLLGGYDTVVHESLFAEVNFHGAYQPMRAIRTNDFIYIRSIEPDMRHVMPNYDGLDKFGEALRHLGYLSSQRSRVRLYDLKKDPEEFSNLGGNNAYHEVESQMEAALNKWMTETDDPILNGDISPPENCSCWPRDTEK